MFIFATCFACVLAGILLGLWVGDHVDGISHQQLAQQIAELRDSMANANERIDAATTAIKAALSNIAADIAKIKADVSAGVPTEETLAALEAVQANAEALAAENPDAN